MKKQKYPCPVCGYLTLPARCDWDICPVCFWEDDVLESDGDCNSPANSQLLSEAQANFVSIGAVHPDMVKNVRSLKPTEKHSSEWKLLPEAKLLLAQRRVGE